MFVLNIVYFFLGIQRVLSGSSFRRSLLCFSLVFRCSIFKVRFSYHPLSRTAYTVYHKLSRLSSTFSKLFNFSFRHSCVSLYFVVFRFKHSLYSFFRSALAELLYHITIISFCQPFFYNFLSFLLFVGIIQHICRIIMCIITKSLYFFIALKTCFLISGQISIQIHSLLL